VRDRRWGTRSGIIAKPRQISEPHPSRFFDRYQMDSELLNDRIPGFNG